MYFKVIPWNFLKNVRDMMIIEDYMKYHTVFTKNTHDQKHLQKYYYIFMKLEQAAKASNQTMDAVHSHDLL